MKIPHYSFLLYAALMLAGISGRDARAQTAAYSVLHSFAAVTPEGNDPSGALAEGSDGNFYGTTSQGGSPGNYGTIFEVSPSGVYTTIHTFSGSDGAYPTGLIAVQDGTKFYGTATNGGPNQNGVLYSIETGGGRFTILHYFSGYDQGDGSNPVATPVLDSRGNLYGATEFGGTYNKGTVYSFTDNVEQTYATMYSFHFVGDDNTDGAYPTCKLALGSDGLLYGTASRGGAHGAGTVYSISFSTINLVFKTLHSFTAPDANFINNDGAYPDNGVLAASDGDFYGTTAFGGASAKGTIYEITASGGFATEHSFSAPGTTGINADGVAPTGTLIQGSDGGFFGTASGGSVNGTGTVFELSFTTFGKIRRTNFNTLFSFPIQDDHSANRFGAYPSGGVIQGDDGRLYGVTSGGGTGGDGAVFGLATNGAASALHGFTATNGDGTAPRAALARGGDGNVYGTASEGGVNGHGSVFKLTPAGVATVLHSYVYTTGDVPYAGLTLGSDGTFYGTTDDGGANGSGTVFQIKPGGAYTVLYSFAALSGGTNTDGAYPQAAPVEGSDGDFYGVTSAGGTNAAGTVYKITSDGVLTTLHTFTAPSGSGVTNSDGAHPAAALIEHGDGTFYGTTPVGGPNGTGVLFKIMSDGTFTDVHNFDAIGDANGNSDGAYPQAALIEGGNGDFYGTTRNGGNGGNGTVFQVTPAGLFTTLYSFSAVNASMANSDGAQPLGALVVGSDGNFYGTTSAGGSDAAATGHGTVFQFTPAGILTTLHNFTAANGDGMQPAAGLVEGSEGTFYGTTPAGGANGSGTVFEIILPPVVTSAARATATEGQNFSYQITATNTPTSFGVLGLPPGLTVNARTGLLSGKPTVFGVKTLTLKAVNGGGNGTGVLTLTIAEAAPVITSATTADATQGSPFSYQIKAGNHPVSFGVLGLPPGLKVDGKSGLIFGTPTVSGTKSLMLKATNSTGTGTGTLTLTIAGAPAITSAAMANATVGKIFTYQIAATNSPTSFGVLGLPPGLKVDAKTGLISGTPTTSGTKMLTLKATNTAGTGQATLTLTIAE